MSKEITLRNKLLETFNVFYPESTSNKELIKDLDRRGKLDLKKFGEVLLLLIDEVESLKK